MSDTTFMRLSRSLLLLTCLLPWAGAALAQAPAASEPAASAATAQADAASPAASSAPAAVEPFYLEAADCSAAYKAVVTGRMAEPRTESRDKAILQDTERSFVFIGVAYKQGLRKPEADRLLQEAEQRWAQLPKPDQARRLKACTSRAEALMDDISFIERFAVQNRAKARVQQMLDKEQKRRGS